MPKRKQFTPLECAQWWAEGWGQAFSSAYAYERAENSKHPDYDKTGDRMAKAVERWEEAESKERKA